MSMPLIQSIRYVSSIGPVRSWVLRTDKGKIVYVKYARGTLTCRYDNEFTGKEFFQRKYISHPPSSLTTDEMLHATRFKLNNDDYLAPGNNVSNESVG